MKSGGKQASPALQSRFSVQLRSPGRVVPIGSGGAFGGARITRDSLLAAGVPCVGEIGGPQAASAIRRAKRMPNATKSRAPTAALCRLTRDRCACVARR